MSEYWKSTPNYWCKHCQSYVRDTPFERQQHEKTGKHQGNLKRFLRGIQNDHERSNREKERAKAEIERLNRVTGTKTSTPATNAISGTKPEVHKDTGTVMVADQKRQWAQLADMGITVPEGFRSEIAMAGEWEAVHQWDAEESKPEDSLSRGVRKRKLEEEENVDYPGAGLTRRGWDSNARRFASTDDLGLEDLLREPLIKREKTSAHKVEPAGLLASSTVVEGVVNAGNDPEPKAIEDAATKTSAENEALTQQVKVESKEAIPELHPPDAQSVHDAPVFKKRKARVK